VAIDPKSKGGLCYEEVEKAIEKVEETVKEMEEAIEKEYAVDHSRHAESHSNHFRTFEVVVRVIPCPFLGCRDTCNSFCRRVPPALTLSTLRLLSVRIPQ